MTLGIGIVGLASFYSSYYAGRAAVHPGTTVAAAARLDASNEQLEALGRDTPEEFGATHDCPVYESLADLLADDGVDAVILNSLLTRRGEDAVTSLEAGKPVLTGKPAAGSASDADRLADAAREEKLVAATTAPHRHDGRIRAARERVAEGGVGEVLRVRASVYHATATSRGIDARDGLAPDEPGPAYTMGYYTADLLRWFTEGAEPERVTGELENGNSPFMDHPDLGSATVRFADDTVGTMTFAMCNDDGPGYGWEIEIHGTEGTVRTDQHGHEGTHWHEGGTVETFGRSLDPVLDRQFDAFVAAVEAGEGEDALAPSPAEVTDALAPSPAEAARGIELCDAWVAAADGDAVESGDD